MQRRQIRLDEQSEADADLVMQFYNLPTRSAAIRFALREAARQVVRSEGRSERPPTAEDRGEARGIAEK